jgi:hypothetical protein
MQQTIKTAEMLAQFDDAQTASLISASIAYHEAGIESGNAVKTYQSIIGEKPTLERYEMGRIIFIESLEGEGLSEDASNKRWERLRKEMGLTAIPKSTNPDSVRKAEQRAVAKEKQRAEFTGKTDAELKEQIRNLTANATLKNLDKAKQIQKEVELRFKEETKGEEEARKTLIAEINEWLKTQNLETIKNYARSMNLV